MTPELCLGTAQFGLAYGITNAAGQVPEDVVAAILIQAMEVGVRSIDTAQAYGNAEEILGRHMPKGHRFRFISKLPAQPQPEFTAQSANDWEKAFQTSCHRLGVCDLDALLLHAPADLAKAGGRHLEDWLLSLRERGLVRRLGISIYEAADLDGVNPELLELVQLPLSLFDQRLLQDGTVERLRARGSKIHARSLYLQGLLLTSASQWPHWVKPEIRRHKEELDALADRKNCAVIDLALGFAREQADLEAVVVGVSSVNEFEALLKSWSSTSPWQKSEWRTWAVDCPNILDPRRWSAMS